MLQRLLAQPPVAGGRGWDEAAAALKRLTDRGACLSPVSASPLAALNPFNSSHPGGALDVKGSAAGNAAEQTRDADESAPNITSSLDAETKSESPDFPGTAKAIGIVGKDGKQGAWGLARSLAGPTASTDAVNVLKNQLLAANPELAGLLRQGQKYFIPDVSADQNLPFASAVDAVHRAGKKPVSSSPKPVELLWDPADDRQVSWQDVPPPDDLPSVRLTDLSKVTSDLRHWRDLANNKIAPIESRVAELGWGANPAELAELARLNGQHFQLASQLAGLDRQIRENTPYSDWTPEEKEQTLMASFIGLGEPLDSGEQAAQRGLHRWV